MNNYTVILSIVIANYNYGRFLRTALESIVRQCDAPVEDSDGRVSLPIKGSNSCVEIIVCDAASSDNSVEIIKEYAHRITWWCSEKDNGQSEAFNKGFSHAKGQWLTWLNADDVYFDGALPAFARVVARNPQAKWITSNDMHFNDDDKIVKFLAWGPRVLPKFLRRNRAQMYPFGPTSFWRRSVYEELGPIDEKLEYTMDLEYWARLTMAGIPQTRMNCLCWAFRCHSAAKSTGERTKLKIGDIEEKYWVAKTGYTYQNSFRNFWYVVWLMFRILDGSMFVRYWKRWRYYGRKFDLELCKIV